MTPQVCCFLHDKIFLARAFKGIYPAILDVHYKMLMAES